MFEELQRLPLLIVVTFHPGLDELSRGMHLRTYGVLPRISGSRRPALVRASDYLRLLGLEGIQVLAYVHHEPTDCIRRETVQ